MTQIIFDGIEHIIFWVLQAMLKGVGLIAGLFGQLGTTQAGLSWVQNMRTDVLAVTWSLFTLALAWIIFTRYIMWHEGTADPDGSVLLKSVLRAAFYIGISSTLATLVWTFGINLSSYLIATPVGQAVQVVGKNVGPLGAIQGNNKDTAIFLAGVFGTVIAIVAVIIMLFQFAIRAAELVFYVLIGPLAALGHLANPNGGVWSQWWTKLVVLSLSAAPQLIALKGLVMTTQAIPVFSGSPSSAASLMLAVVLQIGWAVVGIRGPHMLSEFAYHSGAGSTFISTGADLGRQGLSRKVLPTKGGS
jgi:hypothetical protein